MTGRNFRKAFHLVRRGSKPQATEIEDEIAFHLRERTDALVERGWSLDDASAEARRRFGDLETERPALFAAAQQRDRRLDVFDWLDSVRTDLALSLRQLRRAPTFAFGTVAAFALGVGANATMFNVIDRLLLRPPAHVTDPQDVYTIYASPREQISFPAFVTLRDKLSSAAAIAVQTAPRGLPIGRGDDAQMAQAVFIDGGYFRTLGVRPAAGRLLGDADTKLPDGQPVAVLGFGLWQRQFAGDPAVVGRDLIVSTTRLRIIGVAPRGFNGALNRPLDLWLPVTLASTLLPPGPQWPWATGDNAWLQPVARIAPGVDSRLVASRATTLLRAAAAEHATRDTAISVELRSVIPSRAVAYLRPKRRSRSLLGAVALVVLLIACSNAANLMLARAVRRRREIAIRLALGVSRRRLAASLLTDAMLLATLGGVAAVAVAATGGAVMRDVLLDGIVWDGSADRRADDRLHRSRGRRSLD